jgi:DNA-binding NtrC family response regulator
MSSPKRVVILEDRAEDAILLVRELGRHGFEPDWSRVESREEYLDTLAWLPDVILADYTLPRFDALEALRLLKDRGLDIPFIVVTGTIGEERAVECMRAGASDYLLKDRLTRLGPAVSRALAEKELRDQKIAAEAALQKLKERLEVENEYLQAEIDATHHTDEMVGTSPALEGVRDQVRRVAGTGATVLILGETGTGKELVARAVHRASPRGHRPLVKVNCASLPASLVESELFGHERGAFTGATAQRRGRFEIADGGTLFLDEVGELPLEVQAKLLRVLQDGELERVGSSATVRFDTRIIAATNRDLLREVSEGRFRRDLYYRLNVFPIEAPALRARSEDIPFLVSFFVTRIARRLGKPAPEVPEDVTRKLMGYTWPGNVRELENVIERAVILTTGKVLAIDPAWLVPEGERASRSNAAGGVGTLADGTLADAERRHIRLVLDKVEWRIAGRGGAAEQLGLKPSTLRSRMEKLGLKRGLAREGISSSASFRGSDESS